MLHTLCKQTSKPTFMLIIWWFSNFLLNIMVSVIQFQRFHIHETVQLLLFGKKENSYVFSVFCRLIYTVNSHIYLYMPINIFSIYYISMCSDIKNIILGYKNLMGNTHKSNFNYLYDVYNEVRDLVMLFDKHVGTLVFI